MSQPSDGSIQFYDDNGADFFDRTKDIDMLPLYEPFLAFIPEGGHILDAGCGSGRDTKAFVQRGYRVTAFDASETLVSLAREYTGHNISHLTFEQMTFENEFDAIWACASLLHVPHSEMRGIFQKFIRALKPGGVWYVSFKWGQGQRIANGRLFSDFDQTAFERFIAQFPELAVLTLWQTVDRRPGRDDERWLNAILQKKSV